ncbi:MAG: hypothetical protein J6A21_04125, partial [Lentisphaeria bacterium]|nr:hypothetical protein [Lentisphaeria bacterium]
MVIICPYCDIEISEKLVEAEDGCCPECGTSITARNVIEEPEEDSYDKEFEDSGEDGEYDPDLDEFDLENEDILEDPEEDVQFKKPRKIRQELEKELGELDDADFSELPEGKGKGDDLKKEKAPGEEIPKVSPAKKNRKTALPKQEKVSPVPAKASPAKAVAPKAKETAKPAPAKPAVPAKAPVKAAPAKAVAPKAKEAAKAAP